MFELKVLISVIFWTQLANGNQYGHRLRTQALARSNMDGRIVAILNSGSDLNQYYINHNGYDSQKSRSDQSPEHSTRNLMKRYGTDSYQRNNELQLISSEGEGSPVIEVNVSDIPVNIIFRTTSPKVNVEQHHNSEPAPQIESTKSEEEPHKVRHEVYRPVIQEVMEIIQPFRKVVQQIQPVIEEVQQIIYSNKEQPMPTKGVQYKVTQNKNMQASSLNSLYQKMSDALALSNKNNENSKGASLENSNQGKTLGKRSLNREPVFLDFFGPKIEAFPQFIEEKPKILTKKRVTKRGARVLRGALFGLQID